ncbi:MAG: hypothetical protein QW046_01255 [Candidatus Micrarchaeaceae archaeon]
MDGENPVDGLEERIEGIVEEENAGARMGATGFDITNLIIKKSNSNAEFKRYIELAGMLVLGYYKRIGSISKANEIVYDLVSNAKDVNELANHYKALKGDEDSSKGVDQTERAKEKIANTLLNDYSKRFGPTKREAYNTLVLQGWLGKVEGLHDMVLLMDNVLTIREKIGNSWDYELHIVPLLLTKAYTFETLSDFANSTTNLVVGLSKKLGDSYLAVITTVKILELSSSPKTVKGYLKEMINETKKEINELNAELAEISASRLSRLANSIKIKWINDRLKSLNAEMKELMEGIDPKELSLESTRR